MVVSINAVIQFVNSISQDLPVRQLMFVALECLLRAIICINWTGRSLFYERIFSCFTISFETHIHA